MTTATAIFLFFHVRARVRVASRRNGEGVRSVVTERVALEWRRVVSDKAQKDKKGKKIK